MKNNVLLILLVASALAACTLAQKNNYLWGEIGPNDMLIEKSKVSHVFFVGVQVTEKYTFTQKDNLNALTITAVVVLDQKDKNGATCELLSGGPGSKGVTLLFTSIRGHSIKDLVEIYVRP